MREEKKAKQSKMKPKKHDLGVTPGREAVSVAWEQGSKLAGFLFRHDHTATLPVLPAFLWTLPPHCRDALASPGSWSQEEKNMDARELALASLISDTSGPGELPVGHQRRRTKVNTAGLVSAMGQSSASVWQLWSMTPESVNAGV